MPQGSRPFLDANLGSPIFDLHDDPPDYFTSNSGALVSAQEMPGVAVDTVAAALRLLSGIDSQTHTTFQRFDGGMMYQASSGLTGTSRMSTSLGS